jgi:cystatin-C
LIKKVTHHLVNYSLVQDSQLEFEKLVKVKEQLVDGTVYYLTIEATDGKAKAKKLYHARVYECP